MSSIDRLIGKLDNAKDAPTTDEKKHREDATDVSGLKNAATAESTTAPDEIDAAIDRLIEDFDTRHDAPATGNVIGGDDPFAKTASTELNSSLDPSLDPGFPIETTVPNDGASASNSSTVEAPFAGRASSQGEETDEFDAILKSSGPAGFDDLAEPLDSSVDSRRQSAEPAAPPTNDDDQVPTKIRWSEHPLLFAPLAEVEPGGAAEASADVDEFDVHGAKPSDPASADASKALANAADDDNESEQTPDTDWSPEDSADLNPLTDWDPSQVSDLTVPGEEIDRQSRDMVETPTSARPGNVLSRAHHVELDLERLAEIGIVTPDSGKSSMADEYRMIKRPLIANILGEGEFDIEHPNLIMTTSSMPGEGKTFSSVNLAMSMAMELDRTVLLIDADVAKPSFGRVFDLDVGAGLIEVLLGEANVEDVILTTNVPELRLMPAGRRHAHSVELLASEHMRRLTRELSERYEDRVIIFDSPPLLATTEAAVLASLMSQIVVIVEANKTPHYILQESLSLLDRSKYIGLVLNKARSGSRSGYYYDYRYSYYYGYGQ